MKKRLLAALLAILMLACLLSTVAFAAETPKAATVKGISSLTYNGTPQKILSVNTSGLANCTMYYCVTADTNQPAPDTSDPWSTERPQATDAGTYYVWYYALGDEGYDNTAVNETPIEVTIKPAKLTLPQGSVALDPEERAYDGTKTVNVKFTNSEDTMTVESQYHEKLIIGNLAGTVNSASVGDNHQVKLSATIIGGEGGANPDNYVNDVTYFGDRLYLKINKAAIDEDPAYAPPQAVQNPAPNEALATEGTVPYGCQMFYNLDGRIEWANNLNAPSVKTDVPGEHIIYYYVTGGANYNDLGSEANPFTVKVNVAETAVQSSTISGGSIAIIVAVAVIAAGAVTAIVISKKKKSHAN